MNTNMERWILASLAKHIDTHRGDCQLFVHGQERPTADALKTIEVHLDGFNVVKLDEDTDRYLAKFAVVIKVKRTADSYLLQKTNGTVVGCLHSCIEVKQYGDGEASVGFLALDRDLDDTRQLFTINHPPIDVTDNLLVSTTLVNYYLDYTS